MKRKLLLIPLYVLFFGVAFLFFFWLTLPWDRLQQLVERRVEAATGYEVTIGEFGSHWFTGFEATDVLLRKPLTPEQKRALAAARKARVAAQAEAAKGGAAPGTAEGGDDGDGATGEKPESSTTPDEDTPGDSAEGSAGDGDGDGDEAEDGAASSDDPGGVSEDRAGAPADEAGAATAKPSLPPLPAVPPPFRIQALSVRLSVLPLFIGRVVFEVYAELAGGKIDGTVGRAGDRYLVDLETEGLRLAAIPWLQDLSPLPIKGTLDLDVDVAFVPAEMQRTEGTVALTLAGLEAGAGEIPLPKGAIFPSFELETATKLGRLHLELVCGEERARDPDGALLHVQKLEHRGGDLELRAEGDVILKSDLGLSRPDLMLGVKFSDPFVKRNHLGIVLSNSRVKRNMKEDFLGVTLRGTIRKLEPRLAPPAWDKSRAHLRAKPGEEPEPASTGSDEPSKERPGAPSRPGARGRSPRSSRGKPSRPGLGRPATGRPPASQD